MLVHRLSLGRAARAPAALLATFALGCGSPADPGGAALSPGDAAADAAPDAPEPYDAAAKDAAPDVPFQEAPHPLPTPMPAHTGTVLAGLRLVSLFYAGDAAAATLDAFNDALVGDPWWAAVTQGYGIGPAAHVATYTIADAPAATMGDHEARLAIEAAIQGGSVPPPDDQTLYAIFLPATTKLSFGGIVGCVNVGGYHSDASVALEGGAARYAYAVLPRCDSYGGGSGLDAVTVAASHEYIEAATDPYPNSQPGYTFDPGEPWSANEGEVGDLCNGYTASVGPYIVTRSWSNEAAAAGGDPCVPVPVSSVYYGAALDPEKLTGVAGGTVDFTLRVFSEKPLPSPMTLSASTGFASPSGLGFKLDATHAMNGDIVGLHVSVPAALGPGSYPFQVNASRQGLPSSHFWGGAVEVE